MNKLRAGIHHIEFWVAKFLAGNKVKVIRSPIEMNHYSDGYTIDSYDPNGFIVEVAYTPNTEM
ncbi:hypothetical protein ABE069_17405 [Bacillus mycoides]